MSKLPDCSIAIVGTGMIGASMSALFTGNSFHVTMLAIDDTQAALGKKTYDNCFLDLKEKGLVNEGQVASCAKLLTITQDYNDIADADFIFECVFERIDVKHSVYAQIESHCRKYRALASSTSAISPEDLAKGIKAKDKFLVAHPWNPPHLVPLVELVGNSETTEDAMNFAFDVFEAATRKAVIMKKPAPGFLGNRLQHALYREAVYMVEQGYATPEDIDKTLRYSFIPRYTSIGLFQHFDYAGLDMIISIEDYLFPYLCNETKTQEYIRQRYERNDLGAKTGIGVYDWRSTDMDEFRRLAAKPYIDAFNWNLPAAE